MPPKQSNKLVEVIKKKKSEKKRTTSPQEIDQVQSSPKPTKKKSAEKRVRTEEENGQGSSSSRDTVSTMNNIETPLNSSLTSTILQSSEVLPVATTTITQASPKKRKSAQSVDKIVAPKATGKKIQMDCTSTTISNLLTNNLFVVENYQRPYEWTNEDIELLMGDILDAMKEGKESYFIGNILLKQTDNNKRLAIIDGQQRLTSLCIIFAMLRELVSLVEDVATLRDREDLKDCINSLLYRNNYEYKGDVLIYENDTKSNCSFYSDHIVKRSSLFSEPFKKKEIEDKIAKLKQYEITDSKTSTQIATNAFNIFYYLKKVGKIYDNFREILTYIRNNCILMMTTLQQDQNEFVVFRTLNCRGRNLSEMDVLKLHFQQQFANSPNLSRSIDAWNQYSQELGDSDFSLLIEAFYMIKSNQTYKNSSSNRPYDKIFVNSPSLTHQDFVEDYLTPLYSALISVKYPTTNFPNKELQQKTQALSFLIDNYFTQKSTKNSIKIVTMLLLALYKRVGAKMPLFNVNNWTNVIRSNILKLFRVWFEMVIRTFFHRSQVLDISMMLYHLQQCFKDNKIDENEITLKNIVQPPKEKKDKKKVKTHPICADWVSKVDQLVDDVKKKVFECSLKLILLRNGKTLESINSLSLCEIFDDPSGIPKNTLKKLGNHSLCVKNQKKGNSNWNNMQEIVKGINCLEFSTNGETLKVISDRTKLIISELKKLFDEGDDTSDSNGADDGEDDDHQLEEE